MANYFSPCHVLREAKDARKIMGFSALSVLYSLYAVKAKGLCSE
jgi:hypothetical protein